MTTEDTMQPVCAAFEINVEIGMLIIAAIYYAIMLAIVFYVAFQAGKHRSIISVKEKYTVFTVAD